MINHGIYSGALFLLVGIIYERRHTRKVSEFGGLSHVMPGYSAIFLAMAMTAIGLPLLAVFISEFLAWPLLAIALHNVKCCACVPCSY